MTRLFGISGVQMSVVPWDANATVEKMADIATNIKKNFPWVQLVMFHELVIPGLVQFVTTDNGKRMPNPSLAR
jgi:predicted amidohydrolase